MQSRILVLLVLVASGVASAEILPSASFGRLPLIENPVLSPSGDRVAAIWNSEEGPTIVLSPFGSADIEPILRLKYGFDRVDWIRWLNDDRLLLSISRPGSTGPQTYRVSRLYHLSTEGGEPKAVWRRPTLQPPRWINEVDTNRIMSMLPDQPNNILMQLWDERDNGFAVFNVDVVKNKYKKLFANTYDVNFWWSDVNGDVIMGAQYNTDNDINERTIWYRPDADSKLRPLHTKKMAEGETFSPIFLSEKDALVISDYELRREAVWSFDIETGEFKDRLFAADEFDIGGAIVSNDGSELLGVYYYDNYRVDHYFDDAAREQADIVKSSFSGYQTSVRTRSRDGNRMIVGLFKDNSPQKYAWIDLEANAGGLWFSTHPELEGKALPEVRPIKFSARDGVELTGYLTMPINKKAEKPPLVVFPHGGPASRDYQYFDPYVQFFANLGYAVLQVNFRGSVGFGSNFEAAGYQEWGGEMQMDIYDAIAWVERLNVVDADRKCIVGISYGGYVALTAAHQRPDDFVCVGSIAGVSDLLATTKHDWLSVIGRPYLAVAIGDPTDNKTEERLKDSSPINFVSEMNAPLFLVHGTEDTQVQVEQTRKLNKATKAAGLEVEMIELKNGTHYLDEYQNRLLVFEKLEQFLTRNLDTDPT